MDFQGQSKHLKTLKTTNSRGWKPKSTNSNVPRDGGTPFLHEHEFTHKKRLPETNLPLLPKECKNVFLLFFKKRPCQKNQGTLSTTDPLQPSYCPGRPGLKKQTFLSLCTLAAVQPEGLQMTQRLIHCLGWRHSRGTVFPPKTGRDF